MEKWLDLKNDEEVIFLSHPSQWTLLAPFLFLVVCVSLAGGLWLYEVPDLLKSGDTAKWKAVFSGVLVLVGVTVFIYKALQRRYTYYVLTTESVIFRSGIVFVSYDTIPLWEVSNLSQSHNLMQRLMGYGDIQIGSSATSMEEISWKKIISPGEKKDMIKDELDRARRELHGRGGEKEDLDSGYNTTVA